MVLSGAGSATQLATAAPQFAGGVVAVRADKSERKDLLRRFQDLKARFEAEAQKIPLEREEAIKGLAELRLDAANKILFDAVEHPKEDYVCKEVIVRALGANASASVVGFLLDKGFAALKDRSWPVIGESLSNLTDEKARDFLLRHAWKSIPTLDPKAQLIVVKILHATKDERAGKAAIELLGNTSCPPATQAKLVDLVRPFKLPEAIKKLVRVFKIEDSEVQVAVLLALRDLEATDQSKLFLGALESQSWQVRATALDILGGTHDSGLVGEIVPLIDDPSLQVKIAAVKALRDIGGDDVMDPLIAALGKASDRVQDDLLDALMFLTGQNAGVDAVSWKSWWDENRGKTTIAGISREEYEKLLANESKGSTSVYYGLRVISKRICFIVDASGSMGEPYDVPETEKDRDGENGKGGTAVPKGDGGDGTDNAGKKKKTKTVKRMKIEVARKELTGVINGLAKGTQINIIPFSGMPSPWQAQLVALTDEVLAQALEFVQRLAPGGTTNVYDSLVLAIEDPQVDTIYFLSDGAPTAGTYQDAESILKNIAALNALRKVKIHTIGFHLDEPSTLLMQKIAEQNYGTFVSM
ncbi:MAG: HEAT repeat domain-containing protein [Planctomycetota bacterium]